MTDICEVVITAPDTEWLVAFTRRLVEDHLRAGGHHIERIRSVYRWRGELRLWDNELLMGWYASTDGGVRSKGTMYFVLHPHGQQMTGRWVGLSYDGNIVTGWGPWPTQSKRPAT